MSENFAFLVKPVGPDCNLDCTYCFYLHKSELFDPGRHIMKNEVLTALYEQIAVMPQKNFSLTFQGGEPTLAGKHFYENAIAVNKAKAPDKKIAYSLQTNGLLIDDEWAKFLKQNDFLVGLSIDGPEHIHDRYRKFKNGKGTFREVFRGLAHLMKNGAHVNAMCCLTDYSARYPDEIYDFFNFLCLEWIQFIPVVEPDKLNPAVTASFSLSDELYGDFLIKIFHKWQSGFVNGLPSVHIKYFESLFYRYLNLAPPDCTMEKECGVYLVVEHNGDVFSCDFFVEEKRKLGNIMQDKITDMFASPENLEFGKQKSILPGNCPKCQYLKLCYGGCVKDRLNDPLDNGNPRFCRSFQKFMKVADPFFEQLASDWRKKYAAHTGIKLDHDTFDASGLF